MHGLRLRRWAAAFVSGGLWAALGACLIAAPGVAGASPGLANGSPTRYYVALGDSLATGGGATPGDGYVDDVFAFAKRSIPGLSLENLACAGDSTTRMINGGLCHNYTTGNQLGDAKAFLSTHRRQVAFVTIDIGGDDITCFSGESLDVPCFEAGLQRVKTNLWQILAQLRSAGGSVPFLGMTYYDPYLAFWLQGGAAGHAAARQSLRLVKRFNRALQRIYRRYGLRVVDGQAAFHTSDFKRDGSFDGQALPLNVDRICQWTHMCSFGTNIAEALMHNGRHANDTGHGVLASAFDRVLATPPRPSENQPAALGL